MHGRREIHIGFWWGKQNEIDQWENLNIGGRIILKMDLREIGWSGVDWIYLAQDMGHLRALVNTVMNLRFP
jgi:hypothetical protein